MVARTRYVSAAQNRAAQNRAIPGCPDAEHRDPHDFYRTPAWATEALLDREAFSGRVWEPACGDGAMARVLIGRGLTVRATDLIDRGYGTGGVDFLAPRRVVFPTCNHVVTNPPFRFAEAFACRALAVADTSVAMIARVLWLEGARRKIFFEKSPLRRVWIFSERVDIARSDHAHRANGRGGMMAFAWYVWEHGYTGKPELGWI